MPSLSARLPAGCAALTALALAAAACSAGSTPARAPASSAHAQPATRPAPYAQAAGLGYAATCEHGTGSARAAPYAGPGPHPVDFEETQTLQDLGNVFVSIGYGALDNGSDLEPFAWESRDASHVQLVACVDVTPTTHDVGTCSYGSQGGVALAEADYTITLFAARTGQRLLGPAKIPGTGHACPYSVYTDQQHPFAYTALRYADIKPLIGPYVTRKT
jgi:hypothetical protein